MGFVDNVNIVATDISNVNTVAVNKPNIDIVAGNKPNIDIVAGNKPNIDTIATDISNVDIVALGIADVNNYANTYYGSLSVEPTIQTHPTLSSGDLYFDTTTSIMKVYSGSAWSTAYSGDFYSKAEVDNKDAGLQKVYKRTGFIRGKAQKWAATI